MAGLDDDQRRQLAAEFLLDQARAQGLTLEDLVALRDEGRLAGSVTVGEYVPTIRATYSAATLSTYDTYFSLFADGLPWLCGCFCEACLDVFGRTQADGEGGRRPLPCPCTDGACRCPKDGLAAGGVSSCAERWAGLADKPLSSLAAADIEQAMRWAQLRGRKHWDKRNRRRAANGRALHAHDGRCAAEHTYAVARAVVSRALADPSTGLTRDVLAPVQPVRRKPVTARAYTAEQLAELWEAIFTSGGDDPDLDMLLVWYHLETGARRGGAVGLRVADLSVASQRVRLSEKFGNDTWQPCSQELLLALLAHVLERGDAVVEVSADLDAARVTAEDVVAGRARLRMDAAVFYYKRRKAVTGADGHTRREPWPLTRRRYNSLYERLQATLPWADEIGARPHDLRKTGATFIERAFGHAVARGWLRHRGGNQTDGYVAANAEDVARAVAWLTGSTAGGSR